MTSPDQRNEELQFSREVIKAQINARGYLQRSMAWWALSSLVLISILIWAISYFHLGDWWSLGSLVLVPIALWISIRQLQWHVLAATSLRCPTCNALLSEGRRFYNSPNHFCRSCGNLALLPMSVLDQAPLS